jgi:hypothetical protein
MKSMASIATDVMKNSVEKSKAEKNRKEIQSGYDPDSKNLISPNNQLGNNQPSINATVFVGSANDLLSMITNKKEKDIIEHNSNS